ncbi:DUF6282 family protein [Streptomyces sp. NPDC001393]
MRQLPRGVIDTHVHAAPDVVPRLMDDHVLVAAARAAGYRGLVIKSHVEGTASRAMLARDRIWPDGDIFGGLVLNRHSAGGLNPIAVSTALALGAKVIWLPTLSSVVQCRQAAGPVRHTLPNNAEVTAEVEIGHQHLDEAGELGLIFREIARSGATLATGHLDPAMLLDVARFAMRCGVQRVLVTHPEAPFLDIPTSDQLALAELPNVWFERCYLSALTGVPMTAIAGQIRTVGASRTVLATDLGQARNPSPFDGMTAFVRQLSDEGISDDDLELMTVHNPAAALGLDPL